LQEILDTVFVNSKCPDLEELAIDVSYVALKNFAQMKENSTAITY
jgi:hypothetical protein